jgi:hypothetical protein
MFDMGRWEITTYLGDDFTSVACGNFIGCGDCARLESIRRGGKFTGARRVVARCYDDQGAPLYRIQTRF